jgi:hypothetical protein
LSGWEHVSKLKRKLKSRSLGHGWKVTQSGGRKFYSYKGKRKSHEKYSESRQRRNKRNSTAPKKSARNRKAKWTDITVRSNVKGRKRNVRSFGDKDFCKLKTREAFYKQVLDDRKKFREKVGEEEKEMAGK